MPKEIIASIQPGAIESARHDLLEDPDNSALRDRLTKLLARANQRFGLSLLIEAQEIGAKNITPDKAFLLGAYFVLGALRAQRQADELAAALGDDGEAYAVPSQIETEPTDARIIIDGELSDGGEAEQLAIEPPDDPLPFEHH